MVGKPPKRSRRLGIYALRADAETAAAVRTADELARICCGDHEQPESFAPSTYVKAWSPSPSPRGASREEFVGSSLEAQMTMRWNDTVTAEKPGHRQPSRVQLAAMIGTTAIGYHQGEAVIARTKGGI